MVATPRKMLNALQPPSLKHVSWYNVNHNMKSCTRPIATMDVSGIPILWSTIRLFTAEISPTRRTTRLSAVSVSLEPLNDFRERELICVHII